MQIESRGHERDTIERFDVDVLANRIAAGITLLYDVEHEYYNGGAHPEWLTALVFDAVLDECEKLRKLTAPRRPARRAARPAPQHTTS